jgi:hypothetical protein
MFLLLSSRQLRRIEAVAASEVKARGMKGIVLAMHLHPSLVTASDEPLASR